LGNGEKVWALADLGLTAKVGDDVQNGYLLFSTGHDGSMSHSYRMCFTRVVCQNTLSAALGEKARASLTIRHTKNAMGRLIDARAALDAMGSDVKRMEDKLNFLAGRKVTRESMTTIFDRLFPKTKKDDDSEVSSTRRDNILADVLKTYEMNDANAFPEQRGTAYNLLNAITNYVDHQRSSKEDGRAESAMFGSGDALKSKALEVIYESAGRSMEPILTRQMYAAGAARDEHAEVIGELLGAGR
jgi:phage/plasmid-like protein (TIGR03299 family)